VVVAIGLEKANGWGRYLQVKEAVSGTPGVVRYEVAQPGDDCKELLMGPFHPDSIVTSPVVAVLVEKPFGDSPRFERTDTVWRCTWEPDPNEPLTLYYADMPCELGEDEQVITDKTRWEAWLATAVECDRSRWGHDGGRPTLPGGIEDETLPPSGGIDPGGPSGRWMALEVDFTTHWVIVLRAGEQSRWGGGIWLNSVNASGGATTIDYSVMEPSEECPLIEDGVTLRPTVAIRLPRPLSEPVRFTKTTETIACEWEPGPMGGGPGDPRDGDDHGGGPRGGGGMGGSGEGEPHLEGWLEE
jgi:hypothetical protein